MAELGYFNYYNIKGRFSPSEVYDGWQKAKDIYDGDKLKANSLNPENGLHGQARALQEALQDIACANRATYKDKDELRSAMAMKYFGLPDVPYTYRWLHKETYAMMENELHMSMFGTIANYQDPRIVNNESFEAQQKREQAERATAISSQFQRLLNKNNIEINEPLLINFDIYEMKAQILSPKNQHAIENLLNNDNNQKQLFLFAIKQQGLNEKTQQINKWRAFNEFKNHTGLDLRDFSLKNGAFIDDKGVNALTYLSDGVAKSSISNDFKGVAFSYIKGLIDELANAGGWGSVSDLSVKIAYDKNLGFYTPQSEIYA